MPAAPFPARILAGFGTAAVGITFSGLAGCKKHPAQMVNFYTGILRRQEHAVRL
jgi:spermidine/putrescine transport system substrate-binding protein